MATLPIATFLTGRLAEFDSTFELRSGTGFESLFFKPMEFIAQPFRDDANNMQIAQSFRRILLTDDPDAFSEEAVDALANNLFVFRNTGGKSAGSARAFYNVAVDREYPAGGAVFTGSNSLIYSNPAPFSITAAEMGSQISGGLFYFDIPVQCTTTGAGDLAVGGIVSLASDPDVVSVTNLAPLAGGRAAETNTQLITRTQSSIAVRDQVTGKGLNAVVFGNFSSSILELQGVGMGDPEMMRDIVFNTHIGGKVDAYMKTVSIPRTSKNFIGLLLDTARQTFTATNITMTGTGPISVGNPTIDPSNGRAPVLMQVKTAVAATYLSPVDLTSPVDLSVDQYAQIGIDGTFKTVRIAGIIPGATNRSEIVSLINQAFGINVIANAGSSVRLTSPTKGLTSQVVITDPAIGTSAALAVFGLSAGPHTYAGDGPITFVEGQDYQVTYATGTVQRVVGAPVEPAETTGTTIAGQPAFNDATAGAFTSVSINDVVTIESGPDAGDYRVLAKIDNMHLTLDANLTATATGTVHYHINRTGIKDGELVFIQYYFNPLSIDIGSLVKLDPLGQTRGIRPGRADQNIPDVAFLRIVSIQMIDPITLSPIGVPLNGVGGYGTGGYGLGPYGIGSGQDYYLVVNEPTARYSAFEDSYIVISSAFQGFSFQVTYDYAPEILTLHTFLRSPSERVLDGDTLAKHFLPAFVSGTINYSVDATSAETPTNDVMQSLVAQFVSLRKAGSDLVFSEIEQFITRVIDPFDRFGTSVAPFTLTARIGNTDGTTTVLTGTDRLKVISPVPFPAFTPRPLTARITHWVADNIVLNRVS